MAYQRGSLLTASGENVGVDFVSINKKSVALAINEISHHLRESVVEEAEKNGSKCTNPEDDEGVRQTRAIIGPHDVFHFCAHVFEIGKEVHSGYRVAGNDVPKLKNPAGVRIQASYHDPPQRQYGLEIQMGTFCAAQKVPICFLSNYRDNAVIRFTRRLTNLVRDRDV